MGTSRRSPGVAQLATATCARRLRWLDHRAATGTASAPVTLPPVSWHGPALLPGDGPGSETCVQARCGLMEVNGRDRGVPRRLGVEAASVAAGILAAQAHMAADLAAERGLPRPELHTSVLQAGLILLSHYFVVATGLGDAVPGPPLAAPGPPFRSADGRWFEIETLDAEPWQEFWARLGAVDADLGRGWTVFRWRYERAACSLPAGLHEAVARYPLAELARLAAASEVSLAPLRAYPDVVADPGPGAGRPALRAAAAAILPGPRSPRTAPSP